MFHSFIISRYLEIEKKSTGVAQRDFTLLSFPDIYQLKRNPLVLRSKWISHLSFVRRHSPTEAWDQSSFLPSATTLLYFLLQQSSSCHAMVNIVQRDKSWREKQLRQASQLFQGLIVVFVFLSPVKKQQYTFESQGSKILP